MDETECEIENCNNIHLVVLFHYVKSILKRNSLSVISVKSVKN